MRVTTYGTRGSCPVSGPNSAKYGGNTTCLHVESECLPEGHWLIVDAGTGIVPLGWKFAKSGGKEATILQTHHHHDHTQGFALSVFPYLQHVPVSVYGPREHGVGVRDVYGALMKSPFFPVNLPEVGGHIQCFNIDYPNTEVLLIHPEGGMKRIKTEEYIRLSNDGRQMPFPDQKRFDLGECLVVRMYKSNHPEQTISYRFEERPTGKVFVFVTDHENQDGVSAGFRNHVAGADLLIMDCQYSDSLYREQKVGWGHATPSYVAKIALSAKAKALGLTHHDPASSDDFVDSIVETVSQEMELAEADFCPQVFGCRDYLPIDVRCCS